MANVDVSLLSLPPKIRTVGSKILPPRNQGCQPEIFRFRAQSETAHKPMRRESERQGVAGDGTARLDGNSELTYCFLTAPGWWNWQ